MKKYYVGYDNTKNEGERYSLFYLDHEPKSRAEFPDIAYDAHLRAQLETMRRAK